LAADLDDAEKDVALLSKFSGSQNDHRQFADSVRNQQRAAERILQQLQADVEDCCADSRRAVLTEAIEREERRSRELQRAFRRALLQYRTNAAGAAKRERELLLSGAATPAELRKRKVRTGNAALNAAADVTTALQETVSMMDAEIEKSAGNIAALHESSAKLKKTKEEYGVLDGVLRTSKQLIQSLEQADALDRWLMLAGLVLFALVVFNILRKRIWIPGLSTLFTLIRYLVRAALGCVVGGKEEQLLASAASPLVTRPLVLATTSASASVTTELVATLIATSLGLSLSPVVTLDLAHPSTTAEPIANHLEADNDLLDHARSQNYVYEDVSGLPPLVSDTYSDSPLDAEEPLLEHEEPLAPSQDDEPMDGDSSLHRPAEVEDAVVDAPAQPEEHTAIILPKPDRRRIYTLPVERPVREEL
ncbi:Vesicle transport protein S20, partial [Coemansia thaxteri]